MSQRCPKSAVGREHGRNKGEFNSADPSYGNSRGFSQSRRNPPRMASNRAQWRPQGPKGILKGLRTGLPLGLLLAVPAELGAGTGGGLAAPSASFQGPCRSAGGASGRSACVSGSSVPSAGGGSGPGSWPPANLTSASTRDCTEGWVANKSANPSRGLSTQSSITAEVAPGSSPRCSILRSAEIMASGFFVSSTEPASARYSRERDSASFTTCDNSQASTIRAIATMTTMTAPPPEPLLSLLDEEESEDDEEEDDDDQLLPDEFHCRLVNMRKNNSPKKPTTPAMMT